MLEFQQKFLGGIDGNPVQPGVELRIPPKLVQRAVGSYKCFLGNVFDQVNIAHHAANQALDAPLVFQH